MVNSIRALAAIVARLPSHMAPETTEGHEPYIHPQAVSGSVGQATLKLILRDFSTEGLQVQKKILEGAIGEARRLFPQAEITLTITSSYRNMLPELLKHPHATQRLERAAEKTGFKPFWQPIRGGTDGAVLTARGLSTPNIFTGGVNSHSLTEWLSVDALVKATETLIHLVSVQ
jgi:tripeptide aminopeptidase